MIEQNVQLVRCQDEKVWVRMGSQSGCTACDNGHGCGAGLFAKLLQRKPVVIELEQKGLVAEPGQMVTLAFSEQVYIKLVLASYGWPLLAALTGAFVGYGLGTWLSLGPVVVDAFTLGFGLLASIFTLRWIRRRYSPDAVLKSLHMTVCYPSSTPDMCTRGRSELT
jgi:sigma-E factor negative regulatory protein RseC